MKRNENKGLILEDYEGEFYYKKIKSGLSISFNRIAFIFFVFLIISVIFSSKAIHLGTKELEEEKFAAIKAKNNKIKKILEDEEKKFQSDMDNFQGGVRMLNKIEIEELNKSDKKIYLNMRKKFLEMEDLFFRPGAMNYANAKDQKEFKQCVDTLRSIARTIWKKGRPSREKKLIEEMSLESKTVNGNLSNKLKKLAKLYKSGTLTEAEFVKAKEKLLK